MSIMPFLDLFRLYIRNASSHQTTILNIGGKNRSDLKISGFDNIGDSDFCLYEKIFLTSYKEKCLEVLVKRYFVSEIEIGSGIEVEPKIRLKTLLKEYLSINRQICNPERGLEFYFWDDMIDGAVIINSFIVVRFSQINKRGGYKVLTIETNSRCSELVESIATDTVKSTMTNLKLMYAEKGKCRATIAFYKLIKWWNDKLNSTQH